MKKIFKYLAVAVLGMAFALPAAATVEAAKLAVVPMIISSSVKDDQGLLPMCLSDSVAKLFKYPEYDMVDTDIVKKEALTLQDKVFTKAGLKQIATASGADIVIAMSVDKFDWVERGQTTNNPTTVCDFRGQFATYNSITGKYDDENWHDDEDFDSGTLSTRYDWAHNEFSRYCRNLLKGAVKK